MITLQQNSMNFFTLTLDTRPSALEFYMIEFESQFTAKKYRCIPQIISTNPRYVKFGVELAQNSVPLGGILTLKPSGSWEYRIYACTSYRARPEDPSVPTITPETQTLLQSGLMKLEESCLETPIFIYSPAVPNNVVYLAKDCTDTCLSWSTATFWQLANQNWSCDDDCATFGGDTDEFDDDTNYFVECVHE